MRWTDALLGVAFGILVLLMLVPLGLFAWGIGEWVWEEHPWVLLALFPLLFAGFLVVVDRAKWGGPVPRVSAQQEVHPGIRVHAIPLAGGMGLVFVLGFIAMFWFGAPGYRPLVLAAWGMGVALGVVLILWRRHRV